jgi:hypothetical protein
MVAGLGGYSFGSFGGKSLSLHEKNRTARRVSVDRP